MIMHGFREESVVKNLSGVKEFIKMPVDKSKTSTVNKDVDFSEISEKISKRIERRYEDMHNKDIFFAARKNIKLMPADFDTMPAMPNFGDEYYDDSWTSGFLKVLLEEPETFVDSFSATTSVEIANSEPKEDSISSLKKQIKNCKNPMQLRELNQKLNAAYKKRKRKK